MTQIKHTEYLLIIPWILIFYCAGTIKQPSISSANADTDWTIQPPESKTDFIGVGCAKNVGNPGDVQAAARAAAFKDISTRIKVRVEGHTVVEETQKTVNGQTYDTSVFNEKIKTYTESIFEGVVINDSKITPEGFLCVQMSLNKAVYFAKLNEKINRAKAIAIDGLLAAENADPINKVYELLSSLQSIDGFTASLLICQINNKEIILNTEILRRLRKAFDDIQVKPAIPELAIGALDSLPDTIGFYVTYKNIPINNCPLTWSTSNTGVILLTTPERQQGFYPIRLSGLSASVGNVTVSASIDFLKIRDDLKKLGLRIPCGSFVLSRNKPSVFPSTKGEFIESLVNELLDSNTFSMATSAEAADYIITGSLAVDPNVTIQRNVFLASGKLDCSLTTQGNNPAVEIHRTIPAGNGRSADAAVQFLKKEAVRVAVKEINSKF